MREMLLALVRGDDGIIGGIMAPFRANKARETGKLRSLCVGWLLKLLNARLTSLVVKFHLAKEKLVKIYEPI